MHQVNISEQQSLYDATLNSLLGIENGTEVVLKNENENGTEVVLKNETFEVLYLFVISHIDESSK